MRRSRASGFLIVAALVGCGGAAAPSRAPPAGDDAPDADGNEAGSDASLTDAGTFACGDALCDPSQICLYPAYGCVALAASDGGACPAGTQYSDASGDCLPPIPTPSCASPSPGAGSFDCSEGSGDALCSVVNAPIPSACSRICREDCG